ncbi:MAG: hypothetical protein LIP08_03055 [Bacteroides sp.]|nr:hypothetical protein [Bacteroides sp.]
MRQRYLGNNDKDYIVINGLKWDKNNVIGSHDPSNGIYVVDEKTYFDYNAAINTAKEKNKRCPTVEDWNSLLSLGHTYDTGLGGMWFGHDHSLKSQSERSIFLLGAGYYWPGINGVYQGSFGHYCCGDMSSQTQAYFLYFYNNKASILNTWTITNGFSLRLVKG